jgi:hypothetical protein
MEQPRNILDVINFNIVETSKDIVLMCEKMHELEKKIDALYSVFYRQEEPKATGEAPDEEEISS